MGVCHQQGRSMPHSSGTMRIDLCSTPQSVPHSTAPRPLLSSGRNNACISESKICRSMLSLARTPGNRLLMPCMDTKGFCVSGLCELGTRFPIGTNRQHCSAIQHNTALNLVVAPVYKIILFLANRTPCEAKSWCSGVTTIPTPTSPAHRFPATGRPDGSVDRLVSALGATS
jgi:hypothetical protein